MKNKNKLGERKPKTSQLHLCPSTMLNLRREGSKNKQYSQHKKKKKRKKRQNKMRLHPNRILTKAMELPLKTGRQRSPAAGSSSSNEKREEKKEDEKEVSTPNTNTDPDSDSYVRELDEDQVPISSVLRKIIREEKPERWTKNKIDPIFAKRSRTRSMGASPAQATATSPRKSHGRCSTSISFSLFKLSSSTTSPRR